MVMIIVIVAGVDSMTVAVFASSHNVKSLDPIDKATVVGLKVHLT